MRKLIVAVFVVAVAASSALAQSQQAPTLRIVSEDGNRLPSDLVYGNTKVKPLRLRPGTNTPITIDDTDFFVQQQYVDFLSRFPDQSGFAFWQNDINQCGANQACVDVHRVNVSAAFFLSIEFQGTGYLVYQLNKAAFGDLPNTPVPVRRETFMPDTRSCWKTTKSRSPKGSSSARPSSTPTRRGWPRGVTWTRSSPTRA
jgi:hypothetical protein